MNIGLVFFGANVRAFRNKELQTTREKEKNESGN